MYVIREFEDAIDDCLTCTSNCNEHSSDKAVHAWDEGVAFYAGSLEGTDLGGDSAGLLPYRLAEKRCANFKTCGSNADGTVGISKVNYDLNELFYKGKLLLDAGSCAAVRPVVNQIVSKMTVPLIQGTLRYAYYVDSGTNSDPVKAKAEGAVFAASVLPLVAHCDTLSGGTTAATIYSNMGLSASSTSFSAVKNAFERNYGCLGITCAEVGGVYDGTGYVPLAAPCTDYATIAGYWPGSDVTIHNQIDLEQQKIETALSTSSWGTAKTAYQATQPGSTDRSIAGFSTGAQAKMYDGCPGCPYKHYSMFYDYYGVHDYADKWVLAALDGASTGFPNARGNADFNIVDDVATREEAVKKGTAYMNIWMYVIREFEDAIDDCLTCTTSNCNEHSNDNSVNAWDEGVAFYAGSLEGTDLGGDSAGLLPYRLAEKRCANFRTCGSNADGTVGISKVNYDLNELFIKGKLLLDAGSCAAVRPVVNQIVSKMTVPLIQGTLRYAYYVDSGTADDPVKAKAEGAVFAASVLPLVAHCDTLSGGTTAATIYSNMGLSASSTSFSAVKNAFERNYGCLGITCAKVGGVYDGTGYVPLAAPCTDYATIAGYWPGSDV